jgi:hypothetical protein
LPAVVCILGGVGVLALMWHSNALLASLMEALAAKALLDLLLKEIHGWLLELPKLILRYARRRIQKDQRKELYDDKAPEEKLHKLMFSTYEKRPITSLVYGLLFAVKFCVRSRASVVVPALPLSTARPRRTTRRVITLAAVCLLIIVLATASKDATMISKIWGGVTQAAPSSIQPGSAPLIEWARPVEYEKARFTWESACGNVLSRGGINL